jgi:hypothetical protein
MKFTSYWLDTSQPLNEGSSKPLEGHYDVAIMGGSMTGSSEGLALGTIMADVMDGRPALNPWKDFDWPAIPGYFGRPWFLPVLGAYDRMKDLVG